MLSSINSTRPYNINNNYTKGQNSAKSQPAFGSIKVDARRVKLNICINSIFMGMFLALEKLVPSQNLTHKVIFGIICKAAAELSGIRDARTARLKYSASNNPLDISAWIASGYHRLASKRLTKKILKKHATRN